MVTNKMYHFEQLSPSHHFCLPRIPIGSRVLEFGTATGYMTQAVRDERSSTVTGFEYSAEAAAKASIYCERMVVGDIEDTALWADLKGSYDVITFADVLEHLRDPAKVLTRCHDLLKPHGSVLISIPNVAHWSVRWDLLCGRFDYTEHGLLDNTHLRFFTRKTLLAMITDAGFHIEEWDANCVYPGDASLAWIRPKRFRNYLSHLKNSLFKRLFPNAVTFQFFVRCQPNTARIIPTSESARELDREGSRS